MFWQSCQCLQAVYPSEIWGRVLRHSCSDAKPLAIDLFCGLGGWTDGLLACGYRVVGFDRERHVYGEHRYPSDLILQDVRTLHGRQFRDATLLVASPPCQEYSYMAMPWTRAKQLAQEYRDGTRDIAKLTELFDACFRIQREASEAAGRQIPMVVENVKGAQEWVGRARWHYGSYYLWGDVPALMPIVKNYSKNSGGSWFNIGSPGQRETNRNPVHSGVKQHKSGRRWFADKDSISGSTGSKSNARHRASAMIAKIPFDLARHIGQVYAKDAP